MSLSLRMSATFEDLLHLARNGWKSLKMKIAGSTCSITWSSATSGSLVAALRFFCDWMEVPAGTMPVLKLHSKTFLPRFCAMLDDQVLHAHLLARNDVEDRIAGADEGLDFVVNVHAFVVRVFVVRGAVAFHPDLIRHFPARPHPHGFVRRI